MGDLQDTDQDRHSVSPEFATVITDNKERCYQGKNSLIHDVYVYILACSLHLHQSIYFKGITGYMENSVDPDQLASSEAS